MNVTFKFLSQGKIPQWVYIKISQTREILTWHSRPCNKSSPLWWSSLAACPAPVDTHSTAGSEHARVFHWPAAGTCQWCTRRKRCTRSSPSATKTFAFLKFYFKVWKGAMEFLSENAVESWTSGSAQSIRGSTKRLMNDHSLSREFSGGIKQVYFGIAPGLIPFALFHS